MLPILLSFVYFCYYMPYAKFLLLLPSLVHLPLLTCTFIVLNIQYFRIQHYISFHILYHYYVQYTVPLSRLAYR